MNVEHARTVVFRAAEARLVVWVNVVNVGEWEDGGVYRWGHRRAYRLIDKPDRHYSMTSCYLPFSINVNSFSSPLVPIECPDPGAHFILSQEYAAA